MKGELSLNQINNLLASQVIGRLACCDGKFPYIVPMMYTFDGEYIYGQTNEGKKLDIMRKNPNIAFQVDAYIDIFNWQSVIVYGQFEEIEGHDNAYIKEKLVNKVMPLMTGSSVHQHQHALTCQDETTNNKNFKLFMFKISITEKTGRFERQ